MNYVLNNVRNNVLTAVTNEITKQIDEPMRFLTRNAISNGHAAIQYSLFPEWLNFDDYLPMQPQPLWAGHPLIQTLYLADKNLFPKPAQVHAIFFSPPKLDQLLAHRGVNDISTHELHP